MADLLASWQFPAITAEGLFPGQWGTLQAGPFTLPRPADFTYEAVGGDWQRLTATADSRIFTALRTDLTATQPLTDAVRHWATVASQGVVGYQQGRFGRYALADQLWLRQDFSYRDNNNQEIWGFIIATERDGQHLVAWMEAPAAVAAEIETRIFTVLLAELTVR